MKDREECSGRLSFCANIFEGDFNVLGISSSSIVLPRARVEEGVTTRFRTEMAWRCRSLRFWRNEQSAVYSENKTYRCIEPWPLPAQTCVMLRIRVYATCAIHQERSGGQKELGD